MIDAVCFLALGGVSAEMMTGIKQATGDGSIRGGVELEVFNNTRIEGDIGTDSSGRVSS